MLWTPRDYQRIIRDHIIDTPRCNIWADPGTGKTSATLTALDILWLVGSRFRPALVLAPKRVARDVWTADAAKWDHLKHLRVSPILGTPDERRAAAVRPADVYTINYENIPWLVEFWGKHWPYKLIVADESTRLKGFRLRHGGKRAAALSKIAKRTGRWINLTGTPAPNGLIDLWGQCWFLDYGARLGRTFTAFKQRWFDEWEFTVTPKANAAEEIMNLIADVTISLRARDWFDGLEEPVPMPVYIDLPPKAQAIYDDMEAKLFAELGDDLSVEAMTAAVRSTKCSQITSGAVFYDDERNWYDVHNAKLDALKEIRDETGGEPLLIVYNFTHARERILNHFPEARLYDTKKDEDDWNAGKIPMMLVHPESAGHGLNFQDGGCTIVYFDQTWNLEHRQQVLERIGPVRQLQAGHPRPVRSYEILARNTIDEMQYARVPGEKAETQDNLRTFVNRSRLQ